MVCDTQEIDIMFILMSQNTKLKCVRCCFMYSEYYSQDSGKRQTGQKKTPQNVVFLEARV